MNKHSIMLQRFIKGTKIATVFFLCLVITLVYSTNTFSAMALDQSGTAPITYLANGGSGSDFETDRYDVGSTQKVLDNLTGSKAKNTDPNFTRSGYTFLGWSDISTGETAKYEAGDEITVIENGVKLYAVWKADTADDSSKDSSDSKDSSSNTKASNDSDKSEDSSASDTSSSADANTDSDPKDNEQESDTTSSDLQPSVNQLMGSSINTLSHMNYQSAALAQDSSDWKYKLSLQWDDQTTSRTHTVAANSSTYTLKDTWTLTVSTNDATYEKGNMVIKLPLYMFNYRDSDTGAAITGDMSIAKADGTTLGVPFNYTIDTDTNEVIITNYDTVESAHNYIIKGTCSYSTNKVVDENKATLTAEATATAAGDTAAETAKSNTIDLTVDTEAEIKGITKTASRSIYSETQLSNLLGSDAEVPDDFDDYDYEVFDVTSEVNMSQPFDLTLKDTPGQNGEVVAVNPYGGGGSGYYMYDSGGWYLYEYSNGKKTKTYTTKITGDLNSFTAGNDMYLYTYIHKYKATILVRYPKKNAPNFTNAVTGMVQGVDKKDEETSASTSASMTWNDYQFKYTGELCNVGKGRFTSCRLDKLKAGDDVSFSQQITARAYAYKIQGYDIGDYNIEATDSGLSWGAAYGDNKTVSTTSFSSDDYTFTEVSNLNLYTKTINYKSGEVTTSVPENDIVIWAMVAGSTEWQKVTTVDKDSRYQAITLPANTYKVKAVTEGYVTEQTELSFLVQGKFKSDSPTLTKWLENDSSINRLIFNNSASVNLIKKTGDSASNESANTKGTIWIEEPTYSSGAKRIATPQSIILLTAQQK